MMKINKVLSIVFFLFICLNAMFGQLSKKEIRKVNEAVQYVNNQQNEAALKIYDSLLRKNPNSDILYYRRALLYEIMASSSNSQIYYEQSISDISRAISINPNYEEAIFDRSIMYRNSNNTKLALNDLNDLITKFGSSAKYHTARGLIHKTAGNFQLAIEDFNKGIELEENLAMLYTNRGQIYAIQKEWDKAISDFTQVIELEPNYADNYYNRAYTYDQMGKKLDALQEYSKAIDLKPNNYNYFLNRGNLYYKLGQNNNACQDWKKAYDLGHISLKAYLDFHCK